MRYPYYPYFRGKQFELITIRENSKLLALKKFVPIIEPVRESLRGLERAIEAIGEAGGEAVLIVNPSYGDHQRDAENLAELVRSASSTNSSISAGLLLVEGMTCDDVIALCKSWSMSTVALVHHGFTEYKALASRLDELKPPPKHIFIEDSSSTLYRKHFSGTRILVRDGFERRRNADYPPLELFSELHLTCEDLKVDGFGDFLMVGDSYSESGVSAYAVAIHLTFIDPSKDDVMYIYHFISDTNDTPTDPAGKFAQALSKLIDKLDSGHSNLFETDAIAEFRGLHRKGHFPGLGYVKKLSKSHHIETMARQLS